MEKAYSSAEFQAREAYGRLVALLAARSGNIAWAEDSLADALLIALQRWPSEGVPANPAAWLLTVARRRGIDDARKRTRADSAHADIALMREELDELIAEERPFPDPRLGLLLACAHPAVERHARTPLMLQAVLGISAERMASAFLSSPPAMTKRLVRAKAKLAASGVRFTLPGPEALPERLPPLLDAIYAAFTLAQEEAGDAELRGEAVWLGRLVAEMLPDEPETLGLLSLMKFVCARTSAKRAAVFVPLSVQDTKDWDWELMAEADALLRRASKLGRPGRFQIEAAIQSVHAARRVSGRTDWGAVVTLYTHLLEVAPTIGAQVALAAALAQYGEADEALLCLDALDGARVSAYQPYWATRAHILAALGRTVAAAESYQRASGLTESVSLRAWLLKRRAALKDQPCPNGGSSNDIG